MQKAENLKWGFVFAHKPYFKIVYTQRKEGVDQASSLVLLNLHLGLLKYKHMEKFLFQYIRETILFM